MFDRLLAGVVAVPFLLGSAVGSSDGGQVELTFRDPEIVESSGLVVRDGLVLTVNDSGDTGRVFAVDPATGETVGVTHWSEESFDVEALAPGPDDTVWVGDIGDNDEARDSISVTRVPVGRGERTVDEDSYELVYPHGAANAETLLAHPGTGRLYVATKDPFGGELFEAPEVLSADEPNRLRPLGHVLSIATDGAFFPDGKHLVLRDYSRAVVYTFPGLVEIASFPLPGQQQGEGIAVEADGTVHICTEGQYTDVLQVPLPEDVRRAVAGSGPSPAASPGGTHSREGEELPDVLDTERPAWPWLLTGLAGLAAIGVLIRSLRRR
ncbi:MAG TPA: hypothetical protein VFT00_03535 [Nocardioides sp.]|nr:hypothetical protein [Nocardioides sp.]